MTGFSSDEFGGARAVQLAQQMLGAATAQPALIRRSGAVAQTELRASPFASMAMLPPERLTDDRQYLEDLVAIAVRSAQQAEDVSQQARAMSRRARTGMLVLAGFGAVGLLVGVAGFAASRTASVKLAQVHNELTDLQDMQRQTQARLSELVTQTGEPKELVEVAVAPSVPPPVAAVPIRTAALPPPSSSAQPWPDSRPAPRRVVTATAAPPARQQQIVLPRFVAELFR